MCINVLLFLNPHVCMLMSNCYFVYLHALFPFKLHNICQKLMLLALYLRNIKRLRHVNLVCYLASDAIIQRSRGIKHVNSPCTDAFVTCSRVFCTINYNIRYGVLLTNYLRSYYETKTLVHTQTHLFG